MNTHILRYIHMSKQVKMVKYLCLHVNINNKHTSNQQNRDYQAINTTLFNEKESKKTNIYSKHHVANIKYNLQLNSIYRIYRRYKREIHHMIRNKTI